MNTTKALTMTAFSLAVIACARASATSEDTGLSPGYGTIQVSGRVTSSDGQPVSNATVSVPAGRATTTDPDGRYALTEVAAGPSEVIVSRSGFVTARNQAKFSTKKSDRDRNRVDVVLMTPEEVVAMTARVESDSAALDHNGFLQRQATVRRAYFVTPDDIADIGPRSISDIFRRVPVMIDPAGPSSWARGYQGCFITYLNGLQRRVRSPSDLETFVPPRQIMAAEVYPPGQMPPPPFARMSSKAGCTTIALWTRA